MAVSISFAEHCRVWRLWPAAAHRGKQRMKVVRARRTYALYPSFSSSFPRTICTQTMQKVACSYPR
eukprot:1159666-Pelagomonas_calceolata.AAC.2